MILQGHWHHWVCTSTDRPGLTIPVHRVDARTGRPGTGILGLGEVATLICNSCLSVTGRTTDIPMIVPGQVSSALSACKDHVCRSKVWPWGRPHSLIQALQSPNLHLCLDSRKGVIPLYFSGHRSSKGHWPKQMASPSLSSAITKRPNVPGAGHVVLLLGLRCRLPLPVRSTFFFYLRRGTPLAG